MHHHNKNHDETSAIYAPVHAYVVSRPANVLALSPRRARQSTTARGVGSSAWLGGRPDIRPSLLGK
jgi:hypothetical protein